MFLQNFEHVGVYAIGPFGSAMVEGTKLGFMQPANLTRRWEFIRIRDAGFLQLDLEYLGQQWATLDMTACPQELMFQAGNNIPFGN